MLKNPQSSTDTNLQKMLAEEDVVRYKALLMVAIAGDFGLPV